MDHGNTVSIHRPIDLPVPENLILDPMDCGSGDYCNVSVNFYGFAASGNKGIAAGLGNIQKVRTGERLAGRATAAHVKKYTVTIIIAETHKKDRGEKNIRHSGK